MTALRALLAEIVDYAGLFPPAGLDMNDATTNYATYLDDPESWMLGRFVVPATRLDEMRSAWPSVVGGNAHVVRVSALIGSDVTADLQRVHAFNAANASRFVVDSLEGRFSTAEGIHEAAARAGDGAALFAEIPVDTDPGPLVDAIAKAGVNGKIRTGGITPDAFPSSNAIVRFMRRCIDANVRFKATAGLHHPITSEYRLTYETGAACAAMYGYLNVFLAAAFLANGMSDDDASRLLGDRRPSAFSHASDRLGWEAHSLSASQLADVRRRVAASFGSCSFREPVDELRQLGFLT